MRFALLPLLANGDVLAQWLRISTGELAWFLDRYNNLARRDTSATQHYRWTFIPKRRGGLRLIEAPKPRLLRLQRQVLDRILTVVPVSDVVFGFVRGRSCVAHARQHVGAEWLVTMDMDNWFARIDAARVHAQFRWLGYSPEVADALTKLCTTRAPQAIAAQAAAAERSWLRTPHLAQGAPTSPALANLIAARFDRRLQAYAAKENLRYSRYADDLTFSPLPGASAPPPDRVIDAVTRIARSERFAINERKTSVRRQSDSMRICGSIVNERLNAPRAEYDALRAAVHRLRQGDTGIDLHALRGRLAWLGQRHPRRAAVLARKLASGK